MIDIHCHLLPGIDDGPPTLDAALELARALVADGVTHVVCTPHVFPGRFENRRSSIEEEFNAFQQTLAAENLPLQLDWAGEVRLSPEALDLLARGEVPLLGQRHGGRHVLLELPDGQIPLGTDRFVGLLLAKGLQPVIAHPERNRAVMDNPQRLAPFMTLGCQVQATAGSLVGQFGSKAQAAAQALLDAGWVHAVASDAHNLGGRRPRMADARAWLNQHYGAEAASRLTHEGPLRLCGGVMPGTGQATVRPPQSGVPPANLFDVVDAAVVKPRQATF